MSLSFLEFDAGFRKITHAFTTGYTTDRAKIYYEHLQHRMNKTEWDSTVLKVLSTSEHFPRLSVLLKIVSDVRGVTTASFDPMRWVDDDCKVKMCDSGILHYEHEDGVVAFRCPRCRRAQVTSHMATFKGGVTLHNDEEMARRRKERHEIYADDEYRRRRGKEVVHEIGKMFMSHKEKKGGAHPEDEPEDVPFPLGERDDHTEADS